MTEDDEDAIVALSLRGWGPVYQSVEQVLEVGLNLLLHGADWRVYQEDQVRQVIRREGMHTWVADADGRVIEFVSAVVADLQRKIGEVVMVAVDPQAQQRGVGTALTLVATEWLRSEGMAVAFVSTGGDAGHSAARRLYENIGFTPFPSIQYFMALGRSTSHAASRRKLRVSMAVAVLSSSGEWERPMSDTGWEAVRRDRLVKNELAFRDHNNRRVAVEEQAGDDVEHELVPFVCECGDGDCISPLMVTVAEYEAAHSSPNRFIVNTGHLYPDVEYAAEQHDHYWVVEKRPGEMNTD